MEHQKNLYPLEFGPQTMEHSWGSQTFMIADLGIVDTEVVGGWLDGNSFSDIMETYMERISGEDAFGYYGRQFPVAVSVLSIEGRMPVLCHPGDEEAEQRYDSLGKRTLWYVTEADKDARIYLGLNREMTAAGLYEGCLDGSVSDALNEIVPEKGMVLHIAPGTVYSAKGRLKVVEVSESSALAFSLYDNGETESQVAEALDLINFGKTDPAAFISVRKTGTTTGTTTGTMTGTTAGTETENGSEAGRKLLESREFSASEMILRDPVKVSAGSPEAFTIYYCLEGSLTVQYRPGLSGGTETCPLNAGDSVLMPADISEFFLVPTDRSTVLLEAHLERRDELDNYIDPNTEPFLEGEDYEGVEDEEEEEEDEEA